MAQKKNKQQQAREQISKEAEQRMAFHIAGLMDLMPPGATIHAERKQSSIIMAPIHMASKEATDILVVSKPTNIANLRIDMVAKPEHAGGDKPN